VARTRGQAAGDGHLSKAKVRAGMSRWRVAAAIAVIAGSLGWVATRGLAGGLVYYKTPTEILQQGSSGVGERIRMGGYVVPGSVETDNSTTRFVITDDTTRITVITTAAVPSLFRAGQGVVVEGIYGKDGSFHADTVLVKHSSVYQPPAPGETPHSAVLSGG
jgi:cytochrome c-type biogenesis protein CcmE